MRTAVRYGTFETNSSSVHTVCIVPDDVFDAFRAGEVAIDWRRVVGRCDWGMEDDETPVGWDDTLPADRVGETVSERRGERPFEVGDDDVFGCCGVLTHDMLDGTTPQRDICRAADVERWKNDYPDPRFGRGCYFDEPFADGTHRVTFAVRD